MSCSSAFRYLHTPGGICMHACRYTVTKHLGHAAFSRAVAAVDSVTGMSTCLKVIRSNKDFFDQSLDEVCPELLFVPFSHTLKGTVEPNHLRRTVHTTSCSTAQAVLCPYLNNSALCMMKTVALYGLSLIHISEPTRPY